MLTLSAAVRVYLAREPTDMRRSFDRLSEMVRSEIQEDPTSGNLFVFRNRRGDLVKILFWDRTGFVQWYKRLERGTFCFPHDGEVDGAELGLILEGIDLTNARRRDRFSLRKSFSRKVSKN